MSQLTDALTALGKQIAAATAANGTDNTAHFAAIDAHLANDDAEIADTNDGLQALLAAAQGTPVATPVPTPSPTTAPAA